MSSVRFYNFDNLTPPSLPSGWVASAGLSSVSGGPSEFYTSPISVQNTIFATEQFAYDSTATLSDGFTSIVAVPKSVSLGGGYCIAGALFRITVPATTAGGITTYFAYVDYNALVAILGKIVAGTFTVFSSVALPANPAPNRVYCIATGSAISGQVQNLGGSGWLNSSGSFQPNQTSFSTATDSSISGAGNGGVTMQRFANPDQTFIDNYNFDDGVPYLTPRILTAKGEWYVQRERHAAP